MTHQFIIEGMTCKSCEARVGKILSKVPGVTVADVQLEDKKAVIGMDSHISLETLQSALDREDPKYRIYRADAHTHGAMAENPPAGWFATYKPLLLVFFYIIVITLAVQWTAGSFDFMMWMRHFMAGFFLAFSFFKMLDLSSFADSYSGYDIIARRFRAWAYIYAFIELALGISYIIYAFPILTNAVAFVVMSISIIGVLQAVYFKRKIQCACLGTVFKLPMSTVTIIEDALMILMSGYMLIHLLS